MLINCDVSSAKPEDGSKNVSEQNEGDQTKKGGKKTAKKKDENVSTPQASETKETTNTDNKVNGNKTTDDKEGDSIQVPVLTKEEEEEVAQQRQDERKRKDQEFLNQLTKAVCRNAIQPLGRDRVFRRYWTFRSLRGLFVEDDDPDQHLLLEPESDTESEVSGDQHLLSPYNIETMASRQVMRIKEMINDCRGIVLMYHQTYFKTCVTNHLYFHLDTSLF